MRGQAFEVFRLLIAAVVAGAILMVLLGILGGLTTPTQDPQEVAAQLVTKLSNNFGGTATSDPITFKKGSAIYLPAVAAKAALGKDCVAGDVDDALSTRFKVEDDYITYEGSTNFTARVKVTCEEESGGSCPVKCTVTIIPK